MMCIIMNLFIPSFRREHLRTLIYRHLCFEQVSKKHKDLQNNENFGIRSDKLETGL